jgi:hypothetical protein
MKAKAIWNSLFVVAAVAAGLLLSAKPWQVYTEQRALADQSIEEMREAEKNRNELTRQKARYESSIGREELARKQGYLAEGERPIEIN